MSTINTILQKIMSDENIICVKQHQLTKFFPSDSNLQYVEAVVPSDMQNRIQVLTEKLLSELDQECHPTHILFHISASSENQIRFGELDAFSTLIDTLNSKAECLYSIGKNHRQAVSLLLAYS